VGRGAIGIAILAQAIFVCDAKSALAKILDGTDVKL